MSKNFNDRHQWSAAYQKRAISLGLSKVDGQTIHQQNA